MPLVLMIFALMSILPAAMIPPSAIAQEEDDTSLDDEENLASGIVSDVLEDGNAAEDESNQDAVNTASEDSNQEQDVDQDDISTFGDDTADLDDANVAVPLGIPINIQLEEETPTTPPPPDDGGLPPDFVAFCLLSNIVTNPLCFDTSEECETAQEFLRSGAEEEEEEDDPIIEECDGVEELPPDALICTFLEEEEVTGVVCVGQQDT